MQETANTLDLWGVVELFGHTRIAGKLTEQNIAGANMLRVDVPEVGIQPPFTRFLNHAAIYAINPTTEEVAREVAARIQSKPIDAYDVRAMLEKQMLQLKGGKAATVPDDDDDDDFIGETRTDY